MMIGMLVPLLYIILHVGGENVKTICINIYKMAQYSVLMANVVSMSSSKTCPLWIIPILNVLSYQAMWGIKQLFILVMHGLYCI